MVLKSNQSTLKKELLYYANLLLSKIILIEFGDHCKWRQRNAILEIFGSEWS